MAKIVLSQDGKIISQHFIDSARLSIGSAPLCDIRINDDTCPEQFAVITTLMLDHFIEAVNADQPVPLNGSTCVRHLLQHGDTIFLGSHRLRYLNTANAAQGLDRTQLVKTELINGVAATAITVDLQLDLAKASARAARERFARGRLCWLDASGRQHEQELNRIIHALGKPDECYVVINRRPTGCYLTHVSGWRQGSVNGVAIGAEPVLLQDGDVIELGSEKVQFHHA